MSIPYPKTKIIIANAFSLSMLNCKKNLVVVEEVKLEDVKHHILHCLEHPECEFKSVIGHESTAKILSELLGIEVKVNRIKITLDKDTVLYVFQLLERLPEGKILSTEELKKLVEQDKIKFFRVLLVYCE